MVLSLFGDESADETKRRVFTVAGVIGTDAEWKLAEAAWDDVFHGEVFHAADFEYQGRHDDYKRAVIALAESYLTGFSVSFDLTAHRDIFPEVPEDFAYYKCFTDLLAATARTTRRFTLRAAQSAAPPHARQLPTQRAASKVRRSAMPHGTTTIPVDSSWIESVTYASDATLIVRFRRGTVYRYFTVPRSILEGFLTAPSKGAYFTHRIRNAFPTHRSSSLPRGPDALLIGQVDVRTRIRPRPQAGRRSLNLTK